MKAKMNVSVTAEISIYNPLISLCKGSYIDSSVSSDIEYFVERYLEGRKEVSEHLRYFLRSLVSHRDITAIQGKVIDFLICEYTRILNDRLPEGANYRFDCTDAVGIADDDCNIDFALRIVSDSVIDDNAKNEAFAHIMETLSELDDEGYTEYHDEGDDAYFERFDACFFLEDKDLIVNHDMDALSDTQRELFNCITNSERADLNFHILKMNAMILKSFYIHKMNEIVSKEIQA